MASLTQNQIVANRQEIRIEKLCEMRAGLRRIVDTLDSRSFNEGYCNDSWQFMADDLIRYSKLMRQYVKRATKARKLKAAYDRVANELCDDLRGMQTKVRDTLPPKIAKHAE